MTFQQFKNLDDFTRELVCRKAGVLVAERADEIYHYCLFQFCSFYIEAQYLTPFEQLKRFNAFENTELLQPYLEQVNISSLY
ncbi:MAG: hypothetical protein ABI688_09035 [Bacteroidota bacterium]